MTHTDIRSSYPFPRLRFHVGGDPSEFGEIGLIQRPIVCTHKIVPRLGQEHSACGKLSREIRNYQKRDVKRSCNFRRVKRTGAAEPNDDEIAWIVSAFDRHLTHGERHVHYGNFNDGSSSFGFRKPKWTRNTPIDGFARRFEMERHFSTQKMIRVKTPQQKIGVCD